MGYYKIDRQIFEHWIWDDKPFSKGQAWVDLIGLANYKDSLTVYRGKMITCKRGTVYRSISFLANRWGWSRDKTQAFLRLLESDGMIRLKTSTHQSTVTLVNYWKFQDLPSTDSAIDSATDSTTNRQQTSQRKKKNKKNKNKRNMYGTQATHTGPPTLQEIQAYCEERHNDIDPHLFFEYYQQRNWTLSRGQPMKDWKASVRYWEINQKQKDQRLIDKTDPERNPRQGESYDELNKQLFGPEWV